MTNSSSKKKATKKKASKKAPRKKVAKKTAKKAVKREETKSESTVAVEEKNNQSNTDTQKQTVSPAVQETGQEYEQVDSVTLERIKTKFNNLTGYPIRVMCGNKWAEIPCDLSKIARVLYSVALRDNMEGIDIYAHGINSVTGVPEPVDGMYNLVLPEIRFILQNRNDLLTHGELIYDGKTNRPIGFKNLFCSPGDSENLVGDDAVKS